jgi:hypothetical protein
MLLLGVVKSYSLDYTYDENAMTLESIKEAEKEQGKKIDFQDKGMMHNALAENNKLNFKDEEFMGAK